LINLLVSGLVFVVAIHMHVSAFFPDFTFFIKLNSCL
jgi:hypothetical protein